MPAPCPLSHRQLSVAGSLSPFLPCLAVCYSNVLYALRLASLSSLNSKITTLWEWDNATVYAGTSVPSSITTTTECLISLIGQAASNSNYGYAFINEASQGISLLMATTFIASGGFSGQAIVGPNTSLAVYFGGDDASARKLMIVNRKT